MRRLSGSRCTREFIEGWGGGRFDPTKSSTIKYIKHGQFFLQYADNSNLKGYEVSPFTLPPSHLDAPVEPAAGLLAGAAQPESQMRKLTP